MIISYKVVYLEVFFLMNQKLAQSDIGVKYYGQNTETDFSAKSDSVRPLDSLAFLEFERSL